MTEDRIRRIVRRALIAIAIPVLLLASYVSAWLAVSWATQQGLLSRSTAFRVAPVFKPVMWYCGHSLPGSYLLSDLWWVFNPLHMDAPGEGFDYPLSMSLAPCPSEGSDITIPGHAIRRAEREAELRKAASASAAD